MIFETNSTLGSWFFQELVLKMDTGFGIRGLSTGKDEFVQKSFEYFRYVQIEDSIEKYRITARHINFDECKGPFNFNMTNDFDKCTDIDSMLYNER